MKSMGAIVLCFQLNAHLPKLDVGHCEIVECPRIFIVRRKSAFGFGIINLSH